MDRNTYFRHGMVGPASRRLRCRDGADARGLQDELLAHARLLSLYGPGLGRPTVDTLKGSKHPNMKELRFGWEGQVWRIVFAFDPGRQAVLLVGGDKGGADHKRFYRRLVATADARFDEHLADLRAQTKGASRGKKS